MSSPILTLSRFQHASLQDAANSPVLTYMLAYPNAHDCPEHQDEWSRNHVETDELVRMGLIEDVSCNFKKQIDAHIRADGRLFRILRITSQGKAMFTGQGTVNVN